MASTPWHLLTSSALLQPRDWPSASSGIPYGDAGDNAAVTIMCCVQPTSAADGLLYGRDSTTQMYDLFLAPTDINGTAWDCSPKDKITISSVVYRIEGKPQDMCSMGVLKKLVISKDTN
jgi:hypothetical protein